MKIVNSTRFYLPGTKERFLHLASVHHNLREYICFLDRITSQVYIEELTGGHLEVVQDDSLFQELHDYLLDNNLINIDRPSIPDSVWYKKPK